MLAHAPVYAAASARRTITPEYRHALNAYVRDPEETLESAHLRVRAWYERIRGAAQTPTLTSDEVPAGSEARA